VIRHRAPDEDGKDGKEQEKEKLKGRREGTCTATSGNFLMSENVADIRPTALGKWDEQLVKNTIEFSPRPDPAALPLSPLPLPLSLSLSLSLCLSSLPAPKRGERAREREREKKGEKVNIELRSIARSPTS